MAERRGKTRAVPEVRPTSRRWLYPAGALGVFLTLLALYGPAMRGPFVFDDNYLPFDVPNYPTALKYWLGLRPVLMISYWLNLRLGGADDTYGYHLVNLGLHVLTGGLVFLLLRRFLEMVDTPKRRSLLVAGFGAALFLLHPIQTEVVAYVAGRSEALSVFFVLAALAAFVYRRSAVITWRRTIAVLTLFGAALLSKEHAVALMPVLALTDFWWYPGFSTKGIARNWKLYLPVAIGAAGGVYFFRLLIMHSPSAGFGMKDFTWYQYFFTECRAFFVYLRLFFFPAGQMLDYDVPISHTVIEHGAIVGLVAIVALAAAAWRYRTRWPLASYGFFVYIILMAPTSSFLPIKDPIAERRLYLPMIGLLLILADGLRRLAVERLQVKAALCTVLVAAAVATNMRSRVWADGITLWEDNAAQTPNRFRVRFQLAHAYFNGGRCEEATREYEAAARLEAPRYDVLLDWGLACDCANQPEAAIAKLRQAAALEPTAHVYSQMAMVYAKRSRWAEALDALAESEKLDGNYVWIYVYRGGVRMNMGDPASAAAEYRHALAIDPNNQQAKDGLMKAEAALKSAPR